MNGHLQRSVSPCLRSSVCGIDGRVSPEDVLRGGSEGARRGGSECACGCGEGSPIGYIPEPYAVTKFAKAGHLEYRLMFEGKQIAEKPTFEECEQESKRHAGAQQVMEGRT